MTILCRSATACLLLVAVSPARADDRPKLHFNRMVAHWAEYAHKDYLPFIEEAKPEIVQVGFYGGHFYSLAHTPHGAGCVLPAGMRVKRVLALTPEEPKAMALPAKVEGGGERFTVPRILVYSVVRIELNEIRPLSKPYYEVCCHASFRVGSVCVDVACVPRAWRGPRDPEEGT